MKKTITTISIASFLGLQLAGCAQTQEMSETQKGATTGAIVGAVLGAILSDDKAKGAAIGAAAGAVIGGVVGHYRDKQTASRDEAIKRRGDSQAPGDVIEVEGGLVTPESVTAGATVESSVQYTALSSTEEGQVKVRETRMLEGNNGTVQLADREVTRAQGSHSSMIKFTMPQDLPKGTYTLVTTISDGKQTKSVRNPLQVV
ncbi:MAG: YMGG-like glycine zipper-containing protein [Burkholderiales bacterium]